MASVVVRSRFVPDNDNRSFLQVKGDCFREFGGLPRKQAEQKKKNWYYNNYPNYRFKTRIRHHIAFMSALKLPTYISFLRWIYVDFLRCKNRRFWGMYQYVGMPGQGKTLSMVAHMERVTAGCRDDYIIGTNFNYRRQDYAIGHWSDMITIAMVARKKKKCCILAVDEVHVTFDSSDYRNFPSEILALLSFNRKFNLQFICSSQMYDRIPKKIRDIANYTVICKNVGNFDRLFRNYYFDKATYDSVFSGHPKKAEFVREFIADDNLYSLYDTLEQVERMTADAQAEKSAKQQAIDLLWPEDEPAELPAGSTPLAADSFRGSAGNPLA